MMVQQVVALMPHVYGLQGSQFVISYPVLGFLQPYSIALLQVLEIASLAGAVLLALGILPRLGAGIFMISFGYLFLMDMSFYNNHYYLWVLMTFLFAVNDTQNSYSILDVIRKSFTKKVSNINLQSFKVLITIVYLYAALVKMNPDWIRGYPMMIWVDAWGSSNSEAVGLMMSYGGLFYDLLMPILLWFFARKWWLVLPYVAFHISNAILFNIGMFPYVMITAWLLFAADSGKLKDVTEGIRSWTWTQYSKFALLTLFILFNIVFPLRYLMYEGRTSWHRQGYYFSWRMMLDNYDLKDFKYYVKLPENNISYHVDFDQLMSYRQFVNTCNDAYAIWFVAQFLKNDAIKKYNETPQIYNQSLIGLNDHPPKYVIDPQVNLAEHEYLLFGNNKFINL